MPVERMYSLENHTLAADSIKLLQQVLVGSYRDRCCDDFRSIRNTTVPASFHYRIDLRDDPTNYEKSAAEATGLRYVSIPMSDSRRPSDQQIEQFLKLVDEPETGRFYVHCAGGRHRTGVMGAVYRINHDGWDFDGTYKEMKTYDFYTRWGHGAMKDYVQDYYGRLRSINVSAGGATCVSR